MAEYIRGLTFDVTLSNGNKTQFAFSYATGDITNSNTAPTGFVRGSEITSLAPNAGDRIIFSNGNYILCSRKVISGDRMIITYLMYNADGTIMSSGSDAYLIDTNTSINNRLYPVVALTNDLNTATQAGFVVTDSTGVVTATRYVTYSEINIIRKLVKDAKTTNYYGDVSTTGGGGGMYEVTNNPIDFSPLPTISAVTSGLISLYCPNADQINDLANFLWSEDFFVNVAKTFNNPIDMIIGLSIFPITPPSVGAQEVRIGNIASTIAMNKISQQFLTLDCGTIDVAEYWGSALDYAPFSKMSIFLPYIGTKELNIDDIMGKTIHLRYAIDLLTGSCNAELKCGDSVLYSFTGSVNSPIPITGTDWSGLTRSLISAVVGTGVAVATGGTGAAVAAGLAGAANSVTNSKPNVQKTGAIAGTSGLLAQQTPYLIYELPRQSRADNYNATLGLPSNIYAKLSALEGFTKLSKIHLEKISATAAEAAEIEKLLYEGVIL